MAIPEQITDEIKRNVEEKIENIDYFAETILVLDAKKEPYDNSIKDVDKILLSTINSLNNSMVGVQNAYQSRITSGGCKSDQFWRITPDTVQPGNYIINRDSLLTGDAAKAGYAVTFEYIDPDTLGIATAVVRSPIIGSGVISENLYGLRYKQQPYIKDIGDTTIATFIGEIGIASTVLTILSEINDELGISTGNLIISSKDGVFTGADIQSNKIVGFGTTTVYADVNILEEVVGIATSNFTTTTLILENPTVGFSSLPESDGSYVSYTVVTDPETFEDKKSKRFKYSIPFTKNPFSKEEIGIMDSSTVGIGVEIRVVNNGNPSATQSWKPELEGSEKGGEKVKEPKVGGGKIYYNVGFDKEPSTIFPDGSSVTPADFLLLYTNISSSCTAEDNAISDAESARDSIRAGAGFQEKVELSNALRQKRADYAIRIWTSRQSIGGENDEVDKYESILNTLNTQTVI
jgi:hypothetical protein